MTCYFDGSVCFPFQGPCCTSECNLRFGEKCRDDNGCRDASFCDGDSPYCPPSINKPNKTICNRELVCFMGVDISSIKNLSTCINRYTVFLFHVHETYVSTGVYWQHLPGIRIGILPMHTRPERSADEGLRVMLSTSWGKSTVPVRFIILSIELSIEKLITFPPNHFSSQIVLRLELPAI